MDTKSNKKLKYVHPDLRKVVELANKNLEGKLDFIITCGIRTPEEQKILVQKGFSKTMNSRHLPGKTNGLSHAVDVAPMIDGVVKWDWPPFHVIAKAMKDAAKKLKVPIEWGGDWRSFKDGPHFQLPWKQYPG